MGGRPQVWKVILLLLVGIFLWSPRAGASSVDMLDQLFHLEFSPHELDTIRNMFPEYGGLDQSPLHPEGGFNIYLTQRARLTFSFISEGAGYKNSVGFFTFDDDYNILSQQLIFSNASGTGPGLAGGGVLNPGDSVILGDFEAGTHIGFWLRANGYYNPNGRVYYTIENLNPDGKNHYALWVNQDDGHLVYGVEDLYGLGDRDYNDLVFAISADPFEATGRGGASAALEPATLLLVSIGLAGVAGFHRWRRRNTPTDAS